MRSILVLCQVALNTCSGASGNLDDQGFLITSQRSSKIPRVLSIFKRAVLVRTRACCHHHQSVCVYMYVDMSSYGGNSTGSFQAILSIFFIFLPVLSWPAHVKLLGGGGTQHGKV